MMTTDEMHERMEANVRYLEARYGPAVVGSDVPDAVLCFGDFYSVSELVSLADERGETPRAAWRWLRESMTQAEALEWLSA